MEPLRLLVTMVTNKLFLSIIPFLLIKAISPVKIPTFRGKIAVKSKIRRYGF